MKRYAVSHINWFDYELTTEIVEAEDWRGAILKGIPGDAGWLLDEAQSLDDVKRSAFNADCMVHVEEIPPCN